MKLQVPVHIDNIVPYPPGKPMDELEREYGISDSIKLASNENPWGPAPAAIGAIRDALKDLHRYPDGSSFYLSQAIAAWLGCTPEEIVLGNGSNEVIEFLVKAFVQKDDQVITSHPSFLMYQKFVQIRGGYNKVVPLRDMGHDLDGILGEITENTRLIFLDNPNNPCGTLISRERFAAFHSQVPEDVIIVLDEAYVDFVDQEKRIDILHLLRHTRDRAPVVALRTFSKAFGLAGLRVGFGLMPKSLADILHRVRQPFNINSLAQVGALAALEDPGHYRKTLEKTRTGRQWLMEQVRQLGCKPYPSNTNFFLIDVGGDGAALYTAMLRKGVIVRAMNAYGFPRFIRITVGTEEENHRFIEALASCRRELGYG